jgi:dTDP-4-amino-4,6-dideoxy-D-glucose/dTDP-4-amino-2,4-dideoxy-beta-L-xylose transaminase
MIKMYYVLKFLKKINMKEQIPLFKVFMSPNAKVEVSKVLDSGYIGQGPKVEEFESNLRDYLNHNKLATVNGGTNALHLALHLLKNPTTFSDEHDPYFGTGTRWPGISEGDEVLATSLTCTASNFPILANGMKIKWVDIDPTTLNIDLDDLERKLSPKTKVIMLVHWGGYPNDLDRIKEIQAKCYNMYGFVPQVIEDGAHSFGSKFNGKHIGNHGNITMYSFQAIKHITAGDGGVLLLPNEELYKRAKLIRWFGIDRDSNRKDFRCEADIVEWGYKFHMNDINATIGIENLKFVDNIVGTHKANAAYYDDVLKNTSGVTLLNRHDNRESAFWIYSMLVDDRDGFYKWMKECGIVASQVHERNDKHTCVREYSSALPQLDRTIGKMVNIPNGWWVTDEQREYIADCIKKGW